MEASEKFKCIREENFADMYRHLGSKDKQEWVRTTNPDNKHCRLLIECPTACDALHKDIGDEGKEGSPCPNNPFVRHKHIYDEEEKWADLLGEAKHYEDLISLGLLPKDLDEMTPIEFQVAVCVKRFMQTRELMIRQAQSAMSGLSVLAGGKDGNS